MKVAINGFGRIGRSVFRILNSKQDVDIVAINDIFDKGALTYLLKYDTVMGRFPDEVSLEGDILKTGSQSVKLIAERDPSSLPWGELGVDIVIESTGIFRQRDQLENHITAGAKRVVLTVPARLFIFACLISSTTGLRPPLGLTHFLSNKATAIATTPSPRPKAPIPSVLFPQTVTVPPAASDKLLSISSLTGAI